MYIRRTQTANTSTGDRYYTYRLVSSERMGGKVKQKTLLNLGRHFAVDQAHWPSLCVRIEEVLSGQQSFVPLDLPASVEREAQRIGAQLLARQAQAPAAPATPSRDVQSVDVDSMELVRPRTVGVEQAALWAMQQVNFFGLLKELGFSGPQQAAALGSIIGRMAQPASELGTWQWLQERSGLGELLDVDYEGMNLAQLYRISDRLYSARATIERVLFDRVTSLFGLDCTITLFDLTNTFFEGEVAGNTKAKRGRSKEKRSDCPLVTLGLVLDGSGFVRRSEVFPGNVSEGATLASMLEGLGAPQGALVVMDRGIASEENIQWLLANGYRYLVVSRERQRRFDPAEATTIENASGDRIHLEKHVEAGEVRLYCFSEQRAAKERGIDQRFAQRFEEGLEKIAAGLHKKGTTKRIDKLWERIGRLKEKSRGQGQHYQIELVADEKGEKAVALHYTRQAVNGSQATHPGVYCLRSSETDWSEEQLWRTYVMLTDLEAVFRCLKSELGLRPIYHHTQERTDGHLFITVLAYQFVQIIRRTLRDQGIEGSWATLRRALSDQVRVTATFQQPNARALHVRKATRPEGLHLEICKALKISEQPGGVQKMIH
jgi:transposase